MIAPASTDLAQLATAFARSLRAAGLEAPASASIDFAKALALLGTERPDHVFWAGQACFCKSAEDIVTYTQTFRAFFTLTPSPLARGRMTTVAPVPITRPSAQVESDDDDTDDDGSDESVRDDRARPVAYSSAEVLRAKDFANCTQGELAEVERLIVGLRRSPAMRRGRRLTSRGRSQRGVLDVRRTLRASLGSGGDLARLERRLRGVRPRKVVLLLDVSGSMGAYARAMLLFAQATTVSQRGVETFTLGTRCTRITRELSWRDPDAALARVASSATDLKGGTRLGECLGDFNDSWGIGGVARGAIVVLMSDGWDRGDPSVLAAQMERLAHVAYRVIWVNPLKASPGYEPLVRGMAAALPFTDEFLSGHSLDAIAELAQVIAR